MSIKITIQDQAVEEEDEIIIRCKNLDPDLLKLIHALKERMDKLTVFQEDKIFQIPPEKFFYFEAVDNRVFAYTEKNVYEIRQKLYELEARFQYSDFLRVSKSVILNLDKVKNIRPAFNGRFEAYMLNGEQLLISRQYVPALKEKLGL